MMFFIFYVLTVIISMTMVYLILYKTYRNDKKVKYPLFMHILLWLGTIIPVFNLFMITYPGFWEKEFNVKSILFKKY